MILEIYILFIGISLFLLAYGYHISSDLFRIIGITLFFFCGLAISPFAISPVGGVYYENGTSEKYQYGNNLTSYHWDYDDATAPNFNNPNDPAAAFLFHKTINQEYTLFLNHTLSFWMIIFSILGYAWIYFERKEDK